jgi:hypothetical protein
MGPDTGHLSFVMYRALCLIEHNRVWLSRCDGDVLGSAVVVLDIVRHVARLEDEVPGYHALDAICRAISPFNVVVTVHKELAFDIDIHPHPTWTGGNFRDFASLVAKEERHS